MDATKSKQAQSIISLILALFQVLAVFGFAASKYADLLSGNETLALGFVSAAIGIVQGWMTSIRKSKLMGTPAQEVKAKNPSLPLPMFIMVCLAGVLLAGCSIPTSSGSKVTLFPAPSLHIEKDSGTTDVTLLPDPANPDIGIVEMRYKSKVGELPDIAFSIDKPNPNEVVARASVRMTRGMVLATPLPDK